jgi:putative PIN family toxin of toxin-antitoxin system
MRLIVLDTNVVVSAGIRPGSPPHRLLAHFVLEEQVKIVLSPSVDAEYREVCTRTKFAQYGFPPEWLEILIDGGLVLPEPAKWPHPLPDEDDGAFIALAKVSGAWLITGNLKHYPAAAREGVKVISPGEYLCLLEEMQR